MNAGLTSDEASPATTASSIAQPIEATRSATPCVSESASALIPPGSPASQLTEVPQASSSKQVFDTYATRHIKSSPDDMWPDDMASNLNLSQQINRHHRMWLGLWKDPDVPSFFVSLRDMCVPMPAGFEFWDDIDPFLYMLSYYAPQVFILQLFNGARRWTRQGWNVKALQVRFNKSLYESSSSDNRPLSKRRFLVRQAYIAYLILLEYRGYIIEKKSARSLAEFMKAPDTPSYRYDMMPAEIMERIRLALNAAEQGLAADWAGSIQVTSRLSARPLL